MATEVKHRMHRWLGHVFRMEQKRISKKCLTWNPQGKAINDPKKAFEGDFKKMEVTWGTVEKEAKDSI